MHPIVFSSFGLHSEYDPPSSLIWYDYLFYLPIWKWSPTWELYLVLSYVFWTCSCIIYH